MDFDLQLATNRLTTWLKFPSLEDHQYLAISKEEGQALSAVYWSAVHAKLVKMSIAHVDEQITSKVQTILNHFYIGSLSGSEGRFLEDTPWDAITSNYARLYCSGSDYRIFSQTYFTSRPDKVTECIGTYKLVPEFSEFDAILLPSIAEVLRPSDPISSENIDF